MIFSERLKLKEDYYKWILTNHLADDPLTLIAYLDHIGLLTKNTKREELIKYNDIIRKENTR